jgi:hypothetical protein
MITRWGSGGVYATGGPCEERREREGHIGVYATGGHLVRMGWVLKCDLNQFSAVELLYACKVNEKHIEHISVL